nr:TPM domain-containing protein [uncultured Cellulosilyticum sp.]
MRKSRSFLINFFCLLLCFTMFVPTLFAAQTTKKTSSQRVFDYASLLTGDEIEGLEIKINEIEQTYNQNIYILTTDDAEGKATQAYADDFFENFGFGHNDKTGVLLLIDMDNRRVHISTSGTDISYFTDARIQLVIDKFYDELRAGEYYNVGKIFLKQVEAIVSNPIPSTTTEKTSLPRAPLAMEDYLLRGGIAALIAFIVSMITYFAICHSYTHPRFTQPVIAPDRSSVHYTDKKDMFVHTHTTKVRIRDDSNSGGGGFGGGSSTHTSSGGGTFGGGGRDF